MATRTCERTHRHKEIVFKENQCNVLEDLNNFLYNIDIRKIIFIKTF